MQWWEVNDFLDGLTMRDHSQWESSRFIAHTVACMFSKGIAKRADQWLPFPWEDERELQRQSTGPDQAYIDEMRRRIREENRRRGVGG